MQARRLDSTRLETCRATRIAKPNHHLGKGPHARSFPALRSLSTRSPNPDDVTPTPLCRCLTSVILGQKSGIFKVRLGLKDLGDLYVFILLMYRLISWHG